jgi:zinc protease
MNRRLLATVLTALALAAVAVTAQQPSTPPERPIQRLDPAPLPTAPVTIQKRQLSNGLRVWLVEQHELPVVQMSLLVPAGTGADPRTRYGAASLTASMLTEGAGARSAVEIADAVDAMLANLWASSDVDSTSLQLYVPLERLTEALAIMADAAERPTFPKPELETLRQQRLATLRNARGNPDAIGSLAFARFAFGAAHRSAAPLVGTLDSIAALTPDDLRAFHQATYRPADSTLVVVGDVTAERLMPLLETHFGKWQPGAPAGGGTGAAAADVPPPARQLLLIDMPGPQSRIVAGRVGGPNSVADFYPMQVVNTIVKGRLSSDRNAAVRDYTAGVRAGFDLRKSHTPFLVATAAQAEKTGEALKALLDELAAVVKGVPPEELARAKEDLTRDFPKTFEVPGRLSSRLRVLQSLATYALPDDYFTNFAKAIEAVGAADVARVAKQYMDPDHLTIVIVGERKAIEPSIRPLNLGSPKDVSVDELFAAPR